MVRRGGDDAVFEEVTGLEAEDTNGFAADVVIGGGVDGGGIGLVGNGAGKNVGRAAARMCNTNERDFQLLERAVVIKSEASEFADAGFAQDVDTSVNFAAGRTVCFEADVGFEKFNLGGGFSSRRFLWQRLHRFGRRMGKRGRRGERRAESEQGKSEVPAPIVAKGMHDGLGGSVGARRTDVKAGRRRSFGGNTGTRRAVGQEKRRGRQFDKEDGKVARAKF